MQELEQKAYPTSMEGNGITKSVGLSRRQFCCSASEPEFSWLDLLWPVSSIFAPSTAVGTIPNGQIICQLELKICLCIFQALMQKNRYSYTFKARWSTRGLRRAHWIPNRYCCRSWWISTLSYSWFSRISITRTSWFTWLISTFAPISDR